MAATVPLEPGLEALSSKKLHEMAQSSFLTGNRGLLTMAGVLRIIEEQGRYKELGYSSVVGYAEAHFDYQRSETYEMIRVAKALDILPSCLETFYEGRIGWSKLKAITRIATAETEGEWLEFARRKSVAAVQAEVRDALDKRRDTPRQDRYGLPNLEQKLTLRLKRSELQKLLEGFGQLREEVAGRLGREDIALRDLLLYMAERLIAGGSAELDARSSSGPTDYAVVYHTCPSCRRAGMQTREGVVEVDPSEVERVEGDAHGEVIEEIEAEDEEGGRPEPDRQTPPRMRRKVLLREGQVCANPHCSQPARHAHHIQMRSEGGPTTLWNEVAVCTVCHAMVHAGLLEVTGRADGQLQWKPAAATLAAAIREGAARAGTMPIVTVAPPSGDEATGSSARPDGSAPSSHADSSTPSAHTDGSAASARADSQQPCADEHADQDPAEQLDPQLMEDLTAGLRNLGFTKTSARWSLRGAARQLPKEKWTETALLQAALQYRQPRVH